MSQYAAWLLEHIPPLVANDAGTTAILGGMGAFALQHTVMSHPPVRQFLIQVLGQGLFMLLYSISSISLFSPALAIIITASGGPISPARLPSSPALTVLSVSLKVLGFIFMGQGMAGQGDVRNLKSSQKEFAAHGILRITRHAMFMGFCLVALGKLLMHKSLRELVYYCSLPVYTAFGVWRQDIRHLSVKPKEYFEQTSAFPFGKILSGQQSLSKAISEFSIIGLIPTLIYAGIFYYLNGPTF